VNEGPLRWDKDRQELEGVGALAEIESDLDSLVALLGDAPDWRPGSALLAQSAWLRDKVQQIRASWGARLLVAVVGPSGAGKSTLLNALAGAELAQTGLTRPTTRRVMVYARDASAALPLREALGDAEIEVAISRRADTLEYLTLLDTPDTNTLPENQAILRRVLELADVILAVFPAHNPRLHDNLAFLRPFIRRLPPENVIPVLNMIDRVPPQETGELVTDFRRALLSEWELEPERIYPISAKRSAPNPQFAVDETPLNDLNEFAELERFIFSTLNRAAQLVDGRTRRAERLFELFRDQVRQALETSATARSKADEALQRVSQRVEEAACRTMPGALASIGGLDLNAALYGMLAPRWWGPMGWLAGLWALALRVASFVARLGRRPLAILSSLAASAPPPSEEGLAAGFPTTEISRILVTAWPQLSDALVAAGFDPSVKGAAIWQQRLAAALDEMTAQRAVHYRESLGHVADRLSAWPIQLLLNLPVLGIAGWIGVETVVAFVRREYLPPTYFQNGAMAVAAVWALCYVLLQVLASASIRRLRRGGLLRELGRGLAEGVIAPWSGQLQTIRDLGARL
jgi:predicted GTPase